MSESDIPQQRYALRIAKTAEKDLLNLQTKQFAQVAKKIFSLHGNSKPQDCAVFKGYSGGYRVDQGEYRILYTIDFDYATAAFAGHINTVSGVEVVLKDMRPH